ncbi:hypothetical protein [Paracoccus marinaquae]|uniref:Lipoprotein n=1 Tax=Paracoccus marinaquae TaxID=2841926 RepID=A0ABS6ALM7_9RHOB|nr:hypothetical protein [Paracoccus marinaquae]MBU3030336.1 hypothetical protein [Paracoccus marinaquae]
MSRNSALVLLALPLVLAACGTPQQRCIRDNTGEYRAVSRLLAEVEGNLARGYAWGERAVESDRLVQCRRAYTDGDGNVVVYYDPCFVDTVEIVPYRIPIDPAAETRKRDFLAERRAALSGKAAQAVEACKAAYPEDEKT